MTPTVRPAVRSSADQAIDERALAGAGRPGDADEIRAAGVRDSMRRDQRGAPPARLVLDEGDGAGDRPAGSPAQHAIGERGVVAVTVSRPSS